MLEAIQLCQEISGKKLDYTISDQARIGDHRWWISDLGAFRADYPAWEPKFDLEATMRQIHDRNAERWVGEAHL